MLKKPYKSKNLVFLFKNAKVNVHVDDNVYPANEIDRIRFIVNSMSNEICIDKTYVDFKGTKYEKTFMYEDGWKCLCNLLKRTDYGKNVTRAQNIKITESYDSIIINYLMIALEDFGYDTSVIILEMNTSSSYVTEIYADEIENDNYPGKWQSW